MTEKIGAIPYLYAVSSIYKAGDLAGETASGIIRVSI
jgi:hypothetical protein